MVDTSSSFSLEQLEEIERLPPVAAGAIAETPSLLAGAVLPRTLLSVFPDGAPPDTSDLQTYALKALGNSRDILEQAKCIISSSNAITVAAKVGAILDKNNSNPEKRRPGHCLNRKRKRFSMKSVPRLESVNIYKGLDDDRFADPERYFQEVEKRRIANREINKLVGQDSSDLLDDHQNAAVHKRRPGIVGRTATYRHYVRENHDNFVDHLPTEVEALSSSQSEVSDLGFKGHVQGNSSIGLHEMEKAEDAYSGATAEGSKTEIDGKIGNILDTLLFSFESLDDDEGANLLRQLKASSVEKARLSVTPDSLKKTPTSTMFLTHVRSPTASISLLHKQASRMDPITDPYSSSSSLINEPNRGGSSLAKHLDDCISMPPNPISEKLCSQTVYKNEQQELATSKGSEHHTNFCGVDESAPLRDTGSSMELHHDLHVHHVTSAEGKVPHGKLKEKSFKKKTSLAGDGTNLASGLRRSTRNRTRPLEFWRGEKLLYGRIHDSLATVIGVKYSSPGGGDLKVKSYVSDEYADLVQKVSYY